MSFTTFYDVLRVAEDATQQEISAAYRKLAGELHPDKMQGLPEEARRICAERLAEISEAYSTLKQAESRRQYDSLVADLRAEEAAEQQTSNPPPAPPNPAPNAARRPAHAAPPPHYVPPQPRPSTQYQAPPAASYAPIPSYVQPTKRNLYKLLWPKVRTVIGVVLVVAFAWLLINGRSIIKANPQWGIKTTNPADLPHGLHQWEKALFAKPDFHNLAARQSDRRPVPERSRRRDERLRRHEER